MNVRERLRKWLFPEFDKLFDAQWERLNKHSDKMAEIQDSVRELRRKLRDHAQQPIAVTDWETAQAAFAANPDNYKEQA